MQEEIMIIQLYINDDCDYEASITKDLIKNCDIECYGKIITMLDSIKNKCKEIRSSQDNTKIIIKEPV